MYMYGYGVYNQLQIDFVIAAIAFFLPKNVQSFVCVVISRWDGERMRCTLLTLFVAPKKIGVGFCDESWNGIEENKEKSHSH